MFKKFVEKYNLPSFRLKQLQEQYFQHNISSWDELTTWSKDMRETLKKEVPFSKLSNCQEFSSSDGRTVKLLSYTNDGYPVETVLMMNKERTTICISSMSGCPVGCKFCATGRMKNNRILDEQEIIDQVMYFKRKLAKKDESVTNIVFMGMGEPLFNYDNLIKAIHILRDRYGLNFPTDGITISTVGPVDQLKKLREEHLKIQLTISLHAATQSARNRIIPHMRIYAIEDVVKQALSYSERHNRKIVFAYLLLPGINDRPSDVRQLAKWFRGKKVMINVLQYNPTSNSRIKAPQKREIVAFKHQLEQAGLEVTMRVSHGREINAACGQLANTYNKFKKK